jgi:hypothetical protein
MMWSPSYLYYVVGPRTAEFMDYFPAQLREDLAREDMRLGPHVGTPRELPLFEVKVLSHRPIASVNTSARPVEETTASVTFTNPHSGLVIGTAICIGLTSLPAVQDCSALSIPAPILRASTRKPADGLARATLSSRCVGKSWDRLAVTKETMKWKPQSGSPVRLGVRAGTRARRSAAVRARAVLGVKPRSQSGSPLAAA